MKYQEAPFGLPLPTTAYIYIYIYIYIYMYDFWLTFNSTLFGLKGNKMEVLKGVCCNLC